MTVGEEEVLSAKEVARMIGTDARTFRKFMRSVTDPDDQPGQGGRYAIDPDEVPAIQKAFDKWSKPSTNDKKGKKGKKTKVVDAVDLDDEVVELDDALLDEDVDAELVDEDDDEEVELEDIEVVDE